MDLQMILMLLLIVVLCLGSLFIRTKYGDLKSKDNDSNVKQQSSKHIQGLNKCSNCGVSISSDARFCPYCGIEKHTKNGIEIHHADKVVIESRPSILQHIVSERERTKQERLEKEERENRRYMIVMLIGLFGLGAFVIIMKLLYWH